MKQKARARIDKIVERVLLGTGRTYTRVLSNLSGGIASAADAESLLNGLVRTLSQAFESERVSLFLSDEADRSYLLRASAGRSSKPAPNCSIQFDHSRVQALLESSHPLVGGDLEVCTGRQGEKIIPGKMARSGVEVCLPLRVKGRLTGILSLTLRPDQAVFSDEDLEFLSAVGNQAAVGIENARLYESLKESQNAIRQADRLSSLGQLTAGFAHEIRNTLVAIRTFTQLFPDRYADAEFRDNFQAIAMKEVDRVCGLVNDLLSFARPSVPNVSAEDINEIVENIVRILETQAKEAGIQIYRRLSPDLPQIFIDTEQIKQVSMNIILNAVQSIEGPGAVEVSTSLLAENGSNPFVQIAVRDTGVGIPAKDLDNIFSPFFTSKKGGSGLGLSISRQIVQEHGGHIVVESQEGVGTTFYVNLPVGSPDRQRDQ